MPSGRCLQSRSSAEDYHRLSNRGSKRTALVKCEAIMYIHLHFLVVNERSSEWYLVLFLPKIVQEGCKSYVLHFYPSGGLIDGQGKASKFLGNAPRTIVIIVRFSRRTEQEIDGLLLV